MAVSHIDLSKRSVNDVITIETENCIWSLTVLVPSDGSVLFYGTDPGFKDNPPMRGKFLHSVNPTNLSKTPLVIAKGWPLEIEFETDKKYVLKTSNVQSAMVEGNGWSYDAIK